MEDLLKFGYSFELSNDARKIILDMIGSMQSLFPNNPFIIPRGNSLDHTISKEQAAEFLQIIDENQEIFDHVLNPDDLGRYIRATSDFKEIGDQLDKLSKVVRDYQHLSCFLTHKLVMMIREHLEITDQEKYKTLLDKLSELYRPIPDTFIKMKSNLRVV